MRKPRTNRKGRTSNSERKKLRRLEDVVLSELSDLGAYLYHRAQSGSTYIKFRDDRVRSLRISNHGNIPKYRYKWNIELEGVTREEVEGCVRRFFFADNDLQRFFERIRQYQSTIAFKDEPRSNLSMLI